MRRLARTPSALALLPALLLLALGGCGGDGPTEPVDPELEPFVGFWSATALIQTSVENPDKSVDLIAEGAEFTLEIEADGAYETVLIAFGNRFSENGRVEVQGQELLFSVGGNSDQPDRAAYQLSGDQLVLEGSSTFNFQDGEGSVPTDLRIELERQ